MQKHTNALLMRETDDNAGSGGACSGTGRGEAASEDALSLDDARLLKQLADLGGARGFVRARGVALIKLAQFQREARIDTYRDDKKGDMVKLTARGLSTMTAALAAAPVTR
jgi:hypothetical protein